MFNNKNSYQYVKNQKGWTIVELVLVIVALGILSAFVMPKFLNLTPEARFAKMQGLQGSLRSAMENAHATQLTTLNADEQEDITLDGKQITMVNGYPSAYSILVASGVVQTATISPGINDYDFSDGSNAGDYYIVSITSKIPRTITIAENKQIDKKCLVTYTEADDPNADKATPAVAKIIRTTSDTSLFIPKNDSTFSATDKANYGNNIDIKKNCGL